ncbi:ring finger protein [Ectocarpus siliculosus]|uniref:Ring finger protein n=1 Tax=Ectocarpus siliculosus TaxID=2880 RepID=D7FY13_ECTSI|nr:ring finger protein [Ectocarpus siliculosus]|eukprot:CBJ32426.1 ring finger protein [Ectocarpus siliculosus]
MMLASPAASGEASAEASAATVEGTAVPSVGDAEAESLALARQLMEEEAMASYAAAVDNFRSAAAAARAAGGGMEGVAPEDMAAMQALMEEDENNPDAFAMAEDESLDYDGMLELGSAIGDVRKDRWRMRCKSVIAALPRVSYTAGGYSGGEDTKCLVCQCDYEEDDELRILPCSHTFHTECVDGWLEENEECPTCRRSVSPQA